MSIFKAKKIIGLLLLTLFLAGFILPISAFAQTSNTTQYYYGVSTEMDYEKSSDCSADLFGFLNKYLNITDTKLQGKIIEKLACLQKGTTYYYYEIGTKSSSLYADKATCEAASLADREKMYQTALDMFNEVTGKTWTIKDNFKSLYTCNFKITQVTPPKTETDYYPLAPLPGIGTTCSKDVATGKTICVKTASTCVGGTCTPGSGFATYLNAMINLFIGICAVLAMIMIIMGGIQYMTSELISGKEEGRKKVTQAVLGLLLALGAYAILNTINPDLLNISLSKLPTATITIAPGQISGGYTSAASGSTLSTMDLTGSGVTCTKSGGQSSILATAQSFEKHTSYSLKFNPPWGYNKTDNTIYLDCSAFVNTVYNCVGLAPPGGIVTNPDGMFNATNKNAEKITSIDVNKGTVNNGVTLEAGDVLGWPSGIWTGALHTGHVVISTGGTGTIEVSGENYPSPLNTMAVARTLSVYGKDYGNTYGASDGNYFAYIIRAKNVGQATVTPTTSSTTEDITVTYDTTTKKVSMTIKNFDETGSYTYKLFVASTGTQIGAEGKVAGENTSINATLLYKNYKNVKIRWGIYKNGKGIGSGTIIPI